MVKANEPDKQVPEDETPESAAEAEIGTIVEEDQTASEPEISESENLQQQLETALKKADENWETALRAKAETENVRRRASIDLENAHKYSVERLVNEFLPVKDSLELGLNAANTAELDSLIEGMQLTLKMFETALEKCGVKEVDPQGEKFDPGQHQAMSMIENPDVVSGTVIEVMQKGYLLNDRLIRPAMVLVAK